MIDLGQLILSGPVIRTGTAKLRIEAANENQRKVLDAVEDNVTTAIVSAATGMARGTVTGHLNALVEAGRLRSWTVGRTVWYALTDKELKRRKAQ